MDNLFNDDTGAKPKRQRQSKKRAAKEAENQIAEPKSFETALVELQKIVEKLDEGEVALEESVALFERAQFLARWCQDKLDRIEGKLKLLVPTGDGGFEVEDIDNTHN